MSDNFEHDKNSLIEELFDHIDTVVTVCTERCVFTGLLVGVSEDAIKLVTRCFCPGNNFFGKVTIIRIRQIQAITFCNTTF
ncbi:MAG: hypothetical protein ACM3S4_03190 [Burkholderiales bacterium]